MRRSRFASMGISMVGEVLMALNAFGAYVPGQDRLYSGCLRTMAINARVISGSDPGAVPGSSTKRRLGGRFLMGLK